MGTVKYTGPVASFHCPTEATIRSLKVHFSPKQLGEGDPSPENVREIQGWNGVEVEQRGKNLFDANNPNIITPNCWVSSNAPNKITASNVDRSLYIACLPNTTYIINKTLGNVLAAGYTTELPATNMQTYSYMRDGRSADTRQVTVTTGSDAKYLVIWFYDGSKTYDRTVQPEDIYKTLQVEIGSTVTLYEPYHGSTTNYEFGVLGKNKLSDNANDYVHNYGSPSAKTVPDDFRFENGEFSGTVPEGTRDYCVHLGQIAYPPGTYTISCDYINNGQNYYWQPFVCSYSNTSAWYTALSSAASTAATSDSGHLERTFTATQPFYVNLTLNSNGNTEQVAENKISNLQLELGSTATTYEPYDPNKTVYGGWVDLITGEVQQEWTEPLILGEPYYYGGNVCFGYTYPSRYTPYSDNLRADRIYSTFSKSNFDINTKNNFIFGGNSTFAKTDGNGNLNPEWTNWYNSLDVKPTISLELYEPITYHLTPTQLQTFLGQNNIWSNADYIEVEYDLHETQSILARKQFIVANQPHIVKPATAPLQNFVTGIAAPLKECKVYFSPMQKGAGDPSPDNVKAISGWDGVNVYAASDNILDNYELTFERYNAGWYIGGGGRLNATYGDCCAIENYIECSDMIGETLILNYRPSSGIVNGSWEHVTNSCGICFYDNDKTFISGITNDNNDGGVWQFDIPNDNTIKYLRLTIQYSNKDNVALVNASNAITIPLSWQSTGTIYGGYVDLLNGELVQTHYKLTFDGTETVMQVIDMSSSSITPLTYVSFASSSNNKIERALNGSEQNQIMTSFYSHGQYKLSTNEQTYHGFAADTVNHTQTIVGLFLPCGTSDIANYLSTQYNNNTPVEICYPLLSPIHYSLSLTQLKTLRGTNNIWSSANGDIELAYWTH